MTDVRELLQKAEGPSADLDDAISVRVGVGEKWSESYDLTIAYIEAQGCDWIVANVNGQVGGTAIAAVGVTQDKASHAATPVLSLWLSFFRFQLGDERSPDTLPWEHPQGFAVGFRDPADPNSYGMYAGPLPTLEDIEQYEPCSVPNLHQQEKRRCFILYFDGEGGQHVIAEWKNDKWVASDGT